MKITVHSGERLGKGCGFLVLGFFLLLGLAGTIFFATFVWDSLRSRFWEPTPCTIVSSELKEQKRDRQVLELSYLYTFDGRDYTGTQLKQSGNNFDDVTEAQRAARQYRSDQRSTCYVNPSAPQESVLELDNPWFALIVVFPLIFVAIGLSGIIWLWRSKSLVSKSVSGRHARRGGATVLRVMGLFFAAMGALFTYLIWLGPWLEVRDSANWNEVPCVVTSSSVKSHSSSDGGPTYSIAINYKYVVAGEEFIGTRYNFASGSSSSRDWRQRVVNAHPPGRKTVCYVNPADPLDSVLAREMSSDAWFGLLGVLFVVVGVGLFIGGGVAAGRSKSRALVTPVAPLSGAAVRELRGSVGETAASPPGGAVTLKPSSSPLAAFLVLFVIALFWNGVVWGIMFGTDIRGAGKFFLGIFGLIGLLLLAAAAHQFLALFNPRPELQANASAARLGDSLEVRFSFTGRIQRITRLKIRLEAEEVATYRRGTDTRTDRHVFYESALLDTKDRALMRSGSVELTIPSDAMHTFDARNNKIVWKLELHGEIPRWPDVKLEFPITVLPHRTATP